MIIDTSTSPISERLAEARRRLKLKIHEVCARMPSNPLPQTYHAWERGRANPRTKTIPELAIALQVSPEYLMGISEDHEPGFDSEYPALKETTVRNNDAKVITIPSLKEAAFSATYFKQNGLTPEQCVLVKASDSSMAPTLCKNDLALIDHSNKTPLERDMYALLVGDRIWFRWLEPGLDGSIKVLSPDGRENIGETETLVIVGRVTTILHSR